MIEYQCRGISKLRLAELLRNIEYLYHSEVFISSISAKDIPASSPDEVDFFYYFAEQEARVGRKRILHNYFIIGLYGAFESLIEMLLVEHVENLALVSGNFDNLPQSIKKSYISSALEYSIKNINDKFSDESEKRSKHSLMIKGLYLIDSKPDSEIGVNSEIFSQHTSNFRMELIKSVFEKVGVKRLFERIAGNKNYINKFS